IRWCWRPTIRNNSSLSTRSQPSPWDELLMATAKDPRPPNPRRLNTRSRQIRRELRDKIFAARVVLNPGTLSLRPHDARPSPQTKSSRQDWITPPLRQKQFHRALV